MTRLAMVCPVCSTFRLDASGRGRPAGQAVTKPGTVVSVAVTFRIAALVPAGTRPARSSTTVAPAATVPVGAPWPERVSSTRVGDVGTTRPSDVTPDGVK